MLSGLSVHFHLLSGMWNRRVVCDALRRLAAADKENAALVEALEKRGQASADRYHDKEMECAKLAGQVCLLRVALVLAAKMLGSLMFLELPRSCTSCRACKA